MNDKEAMSSEVFRMDKFKIGFSKEDYGLSCCAFDISNAFRMGNLRKTINNF
jgi:hypothetical protein